jgi:polar amino acid transport system permease protein
MNGVLDDIGRLLPGFGTSLLLTFFTLLIGIPTTVLAGLGLRSKVRALAIVVNILVELLRGMPALITLYFVYYGFPAAGLLLSDTLAICIAFGLTFVAYTSPVLSAAIAMVPREHVEAGQALGLDRWTITTRIVLPQAVRAALPPLISWSVVLFQATSLASVVGASDLFAVATGLGAQRFEYVYYILLASVFYAIVSIPLLALAARMLGNTGGGGRARRLARAMAKPSSMAPA